MSDDVRLDEFWTALKDRLNADSRMTNALYGPNRVFRATDDYEAVRGGENEPWGRVVILPVSPAWEIVAVPGETRKTNFLIRAEFNDYEEEGYEVSFDLEAAQEAAYLSLEGWTPVFPRVQVAFNVYRYSYPQPIPYMDDPTGTWWTSSEYRFEAAPVVVP